MPIPFWRGYLSLVTTRVCVAMRTVCPSVRLSVCFYANLSVSSCDIWMKPDGTDSTHRSRTQMILWKTNSSVLGTTILKSVVQQLSHKADQQVYLSFDTTKMYVFCNLFLRVEFEIWLRSLNKNNIDIARSHMLKSVLECFCIKILCHRQVPMLLSGCLLENVVRDRCV